MYIETKKEAHTHRRTRFFYTVCICSYIRDCGFMELCFYSKSRDGVVLVFSGFLWVL